MSIFVFDLVERQRDFLQSQSYEQAISLSQTLATNSTTWLLANDIIGLEEIVSSLTSYPDLKYAMILSPNGRVVGHTDSSKTGLYVSDDVSKSFLGKSTGEFTLINDNAMIDVVSPVLSNGKLIGWARVAVGQERIAEGLQVVTKEGVLYTIMAILVGTLFALYMARGLTSGLQHVVTIADKIAGGERDIRVTLDRQDELGHLGHDFNVMLDALTQREQQISATKEKLVESEERFDLAMKGANDGLWDWDINTNKVYYSPRWAEMLGYDIDELSDSLDEWDKRIHPDDLEQADQSLKSHLDGKTPYYESVQRKMHKDGHYRWHLERGIAVRDEKNIPYRMVGTTTDFTARKLAEDQLHDEKERAEITLHSIGDGVITTDSEGKINYMNPIAEYITAWHSAEAKGKYLEELITLKNEHNGEIVDSPIERCLNEGVVIDLERDSVLINRKGIENAIEDSVAPIRDQDGNIIGTVMVFHDVAETRELTKKMSWQAKHDALTGLYNRVEFERRLKDLLDSAQSEKNIHSFLYLDLDQFKIVNDTCGHVAGDELIKQLAFLLNNQVRETDMLARLGGDEFGLLLCCCTQTKAVDIAEKLRTIVNNFRFVWQDKTFDVGVSIGLVEINETSESITSVLSSADIACYAAKDRGRNRIHIYQPDDSELSKRHGEMQWVTHIQKALKEDRFVLYGQTIQPIKQGDQHTEILVRMIDEQGNIIPPFTFIPAAERYNLMKSIDMWVIENAFRYIETKQIKIAINISGNSLGDDEFLSVVKKLFHHYNVNASDVCFEITETAAITHLATAERFIRELKKEGCEFALDDFGSGLSSFAYLKNLSVDYLKIDGSFVKDILDNPVDQAMVRSINEVGHVMGIRTIAEFVENEQILDMLASIGVDYAQGYGIDKPVELLLPPASAATP